jgi:hypothetical protein
MTTQAPSEGQQGTLEGMDSPDLSVDTAVGTSAELPVNEVAPAPTPVGAAPEPTAAPSVTISQEQLAAMQRRNEELERGAANAERQRIASEIEYQAQTRAAQLIEGGLTPDQAQAQAREYRNTQARILQLEQSASQAGYEAQAKLEVASQIAKQAGSGVTTESLMQYTTPNEMQLAAEIQKLKADTVSAKQANVPAQEFGGGIAQASGSATSIADRHAIGMKETELTDAEHAELGRRLRIVG